MAAVFPEDARVFVVTLSGGQVEFDKLFAFPNVGDIVMDVVTTRPATGDGRGALEKVANEAARVPRHIDMKLWTCV
jgi:hypothetical protein